MRWTPAFLLFLYQVQRQPERFPRICHRPVSSDASSITRASSTDFSFYLGGPLQRPDPLRFHIFVPTPVIWLRSSKTTPHVSHYSSCAIYLDFSAFAQSLSSLLMRRAFFFFFENDDVIPRSRSQMKYTFWSWVNTWKVKRMWMEPR